MPRMVWNAYLTDNWKHLICRIYYGDVPTSKVKSKAVIIIQDKFCRLSFKYIFSISKISAILYFFKYTLMLLELNNYLETFRIINDNQKIIQPIFFLI